MSKINIENPTITINVDGTMPSPKNVKLLIYQCDLAALWFLSFYNKYAEVQKVKPSEYRFSDGLYYKVPLISGTNFNFFDHLLRYEKWKQAQDSNYYGYVSGIGTILASLIAPLSGSGLSCAESNFGTFSPNIGGFSQAGNLNIHAIKAKIFASFLLFYSLSKTIHRQGACLIHTTMVQSSDYDFYYKYLANYNLAISELTFVNTNTGRILSAVDYLTWDINDKICNGGLDLEELFLLPDFKDSKTSQEYLFKNLNHAIEHLIQKK